jgi:hypothetical protein
MKKLKEFKTVLIVAAVVLIGLPGYAFLGIEDTVEFGPVTFAQMLAQVGSLGSIASWQASTLTKVIEEVQTAQKIYGNAVQVYSLAQQQASYLRNKDLLRTVGYVAQHASIPGHPEWDGALTMAAGVSAAGTTWQRMATPGSSLKNRIDLADSFGASMLNSLGNCYAAAQQNIGPLASLQSLAASVDPEANTRATQANIANMSFSQALRIQQCQQNLQLQQAKLQTLDALATRERDQAIYSMRTEDATIRGSLSVGDTTGQIRNIVDR